MNTDNKAHGTQEDNQYQKPDQNIELDNADATYGHTISDSPFKRKNVPDEDHMAKVNDAEEDVNKNLTNTNLSEGEDLANRNADEDKGLGGKDL